jgi:glycosyltransferase involved in cell wall biosynthesis
MTKYISKNSQSFSKRMRCPTLNELPPPPPEKTGWPWTEESPQLPEKTPNGKEYPKISIVTPSYNQGQFIEETIRSVLLQGYPNLEYIIIDGGSTDNSVEIIKKYEPWLAYWVSEPDRGQSHAINKGWEKSTGDYLAWMNSDDLYLPYAVHQMIKVINNYNYDFIYSSSYYIGTSLEKSSVIEAHKTRDFKLKNLLKFFNGVQYIIPSQSVFISKETLKKVGLLNENLNYCMDLDLFARIILTKPHAYIGSKPISFFRNHDRSKTSQQNQAMRNESIKIAQKYASFLTMKDWQEISNLMLYSQYFIEYSTGFRNATIKNLLKIAIKFPLESLTDTRFLGLIKRRILSF